MNKQCVISENIHIPPKEGICVVTPSLLWIFSMIYMEKTRQINPLSHRKFKPFHGGGTNILFNYHNLLCSKKASRQIYCPKGLTDEEDAETGELIPGSWRSSAMQMSSLPIPSTGHNSSNKAKAVRDAFTEYFCNEGSVPWQ